MVKIITDSTCDFTLEQAEKLGVKMMCLKVSFGNVEYIDKKTITNEEFYQKLSTSDTIPTTALISVGEFLEAYDEFPDDDIVVITLSSTLSGTYQSAKVACEMTGRSNIYVIDSKTVTLGLGLLVKQAVRIAEKGLSGAEVYEKVMALTEKVLVMGMIDTLKYLVKGGRISGVQGSIGSLIGLKPLIFIEAGEIKNFAKARGSKAGIVKLEEIRTDLNIDYDKGLLFAHAENESLIREYISLFNLKEAPDILCMGSVVGAHVGPGVIAVAFFLNN